MNENPVSIVNGTKNYECKHMVKTLMRTVVYITIKYRHVALFCSFILVIVAANWSIKEWGFVPIGFGLMAPAGVYFAGLAFSIRDGLHESTMGKGEMPYLKRLQCIFGYPLLMNKGRIGTLVLSNAAGLVLNSILFLYDARWIIAAIILGAGISYMLEDVDKFAIASGTAFLASELADFAVYTPLRNKGKIGALLLSNAVGLVLDSIIFLYLAFGSLEFLSGQVTAKAYMTGAVLVLMLCYRLIKR